MFSDASPIDVVVVGGGGFAKEVVEYLSDSLEAQSRPMRVKGVLSPSAPTWSVPHLGVEDEYVFSRNEIAVVAVGDSGLRATLARRIAAAGARLATITHRSAWVSPSALIEPGCVFAPFAFVGAAARVGSGVVLNTYASIGHDAVVGSFCTLSPYAAVNGNVRLGPRSFLGSHAVVLPGVEMERDSKLAAGSVLTQSAPAGSLLTGNPAKGRVMFRVSDDE